MADPPIISYESYVAQPKVRKPIRFALVSVLGLLLGLAGMVGNCIGVVEVYNWPAASTAVAVRQHFTRPLERRMAAPMPPRSSSGPAEVPLLRLMQVQSNPIPAPQPLLSRAMIGFIMLENSLSACVGFVLMKLSRMMLRGSRRTLIWAKIYTLTALALAITAFAIGLYWGPNIAGYLDIRGDRPMQLVQNNLVLLLLSCLWPAVVWLTTRGPLAETYFTLE